MFSRCYWACDLRLNERPHHCGQANWVGGWGLGVRGWGLRFRVQGSEFRFQSSGFRVSGLGLSWMRTSTRSAGGAHSDASGSPPSANSFHSPQTYLQIVMVHAVMAYIVMADVVMAFHRKQGLLITTLPSKPIYPCPICSCPRPYNEKTLVCARLQTDTCMPSSSHM